jgi:hypothetical protein
MTARIPENVSKWLVRRHPGNTMPPRDPDEDDDAGDDDDDAAPSEDLEPAVIREPDE